MGFRRAAKVDLNQKQIVRELRAQGYRVDIVSQVKKLYDLVVTGKITGSNDIRTVRVELKSEGGMLTPDEHEYHRSEPYPETLIVAFSTEDILDWFRKAYLTRKGLSKNEVTYVSAAVVVPGVTPTTPSFTTSKKPGRVATPKSMMNATLSSLITVNTSTASLTQGRGGKGSGKSKSNATAKKK